MRLGNLLDKSTIKQLYAVTAVPWHKRPDRERMQAVNAACTKESARIGQFVDKKCRRFCSEEIPYGRKFLTEWIAAHATALAETHKSWNEQACITHGMHDILAFYGYSANHNRLSHEFSRFQAR